MVLDLVHDERRAHGTVSGGPTTYTLDPAADFVSDETCTVTVVDAGVTDQ